MLELKKTSDELSSRLSDERNEMATLKKKHAANLKDLTKQIQALEKRAAATHQPTTTNQSISSDTSMTSERSRVKREDSVSSLSIEKDFTGSEQQHSTMTSDFLSGEDLLSLGGGGEVSSMSMGGGGGRFQHEVSCDGLVSMVGGGGGNRSIDDVYVFDIDKQKLIEKIVRLQKKLAKSNEKIDFLQDHVNQLTEDLKRKTRSHN